MLRPEMIVLYSFYVLCGVAILYSLMIAPVGDEHLAGPEPVAVRLLVLHHQFLALPDGDLQRPLGHAAAAGSARSSFRCWSW